MSNYVRELLPLKILINEVVDNLGVNNENLIFVSKSTTYEDKKCAITLSKSTSIILLQSTLLLSIIGSVRTFERNLLFGRLNLIIRRQIFSPKVYNVNYLSVLVNFYAIDKPSDKR